MVHRSGPPRAAGLRNGDDRNVIHDDPVVIVVRDVVTMTWMVEVVLPVRMNDVVNHVRPQHYYHCIDDSRNVDRRMAVNHDGRHQRCIAHENRRIVGVQLHDDCDSDDRSRHDMVGPDLHDDDAHIPRHHIQDRYY